MGKKIIENALTIKRLIANGEIKYAEIARILDISRQKVFIGLTKILKSLKNGGKNSANFILTRLSN